MARKTTEQRLSDLDNDPHIVKMKEQRLKFRAKLKEATA